MVSNLISTGLDFFGLYPNGKMVIFAKIAVSHEFPPFKGHEQEADIP